MPTTTLRRRRRRPVRQGRHDRFLHVRGDEAVFDFGGIIGAVIVLVVIGYILNRSSGMQP